MTRLLRPAGTAATMLLKDGESAVNVATYRLESK